MDVKMDQPGKGVGDMRSGIWGRERRMVLDDEDKEDEKEQKGRGAESEGAGRKPLFLCVPKTHPCTGQSMPGQAPIGSWMATSLT